MIKLDARQTLRLGGKGFSSVGPKTVEEAIALLKQRPDDAQVHQYLGDLHFERRELMEAWRAYMQSLRPNADDVWTCLKFGTLLTICADKHYAWQLIDRAIKLE